MFLEEIGRISKIFKSILKEKSIKIFSHNDCDGITSSSILAKALIREGVNFQLRIVKQLTKKEIGEIQFNSNDFFVFTDLGSGQVNLLERILDCTQILIIDHHEPKNYEHLNLFHLNPLVYGEEEIPSSMISYLFAKALSLKNTDLIDLAIVGAVADAQDEKWEFKGLAKKVLEEAETLGRITITKGLRLYGRNIRPVHKALELTFDPLIPGISGSESNAVQFLSELNIPVKEHGEWRKLSDLSIEEQKRLASAIIIERLRSRHSDAEDIFGDIYTIQDRPLELQDAREFATLVNACARSERTEVGIKLCLGDLMAVSEALDAFETYRKAISEAINWIRENKDTVLTKDYAIYLLGGSKISDTLIGPITSILLNSNIINTGKPIFGFAETQDGNTKISARASRDLKKINLREIIVKAAEEVEGEGGGHVHAAGGLIPKGKEDKFIEIIDSMLGELLDKKED